MFKFSRYPVASSLVLGLILVAVLSVVASLFTLWMTTVLAGDARAINLSGSLRMQSYRIAFAIQNQAQQAQLDALLDEFDERLFSPELQGHIPLEAAQLRQQFQRVAEQFSAMKIDAQTKPSRYLSQVDTFVVEIDQLVALLEQWSESKVARLRQQQVIIGVITLMAASLFALVIFYRVVAPLQQLLHAVIGISGGNRSARLTYQRADEFGELSRTFNFMAQEIEEAHTSLESKIAEQTRKLSRNNKILEFLFNLSQSLGDDSVHIDLQKGEALAQLKQICPDFDFHWSAKDSFTDAQQFVVKCASDRSHLVCRHSNEIDEWQTRLFITVGELFDSAMNRMGTYKNENRIALLNERSSIARELHDSLAQQLSYLKIQVVRWIKLKERGADEAILDEIVNDLREGLNTSYRKLRELLVTFRAQSDEPGLIPSVKAAADEINRISQNTKIHLYIDDQWPEDLSPSQEIHCLHVIREALTNVIKHAQAENAVVSLQTTQQGLQIKINDDGIGFEENPEKPMHYGLTIMHERASRIGGEIHYQTLKCGGAGVSLTFKPLQQKEEES